MTSNTVAGHVQTLSTVSKTSYTAYRAHNPLYAQAAFHNTRGTTPVTT